MKHQFFLLFVALIGITASAQVGINTLTPNPNAALDINSTSSGLLPPRMTESQRNAIDEPIPSGLQVWCINCGPNGEMQVYNGSNWTNLAGMPAALGTFICGTSSVTFNYRGSSETYGTVVSAGRCWLDRNLGASQVALTTDDAAAYGDLFQWGRGADGHQIRNPLSQTTATLSSGDTPGHNKFISQSSSPLDWRSPQNANLWQGVTGANNPCPTGYRLPTDVEWDAERISWGGNQNSVGAFNSPLKLSIAGYRDGTGTGLLYYVAFQGLYWSSTVSGTESKVFRFYNVNTDQVGNNRSDGFSVRCIKDGTTLGSIGSLDCSGATINGTLTEGIAASGVSAVVSYANGNGAAHSGQTVLSFGVSGLTATLVAGTFISGTGSLTYTITGTPDFEGTAEFELNIGGQMCILKVEIASAVFTCGTSTVTFPYNGNSVTYGTVVGAGGRCWLDRNLGASQVATSSTDAAAYGDLFQWGRGDDGHQIRTSPLINTLSNTDNPGHGSFITTNSNWRSPQNNSLWQGVNGINNPCPTGFRVPTYAEISTERASWGGNKNLIGAFNSPLKLPAAGRRILNGSLSIVGSNGSYWSSSISGGYSYYLDFYNGGAGSSILKRAFGSCVRCIKD